MDRIVLATKFKGGIDISGKAKEKYEDENHTMGSCAVRLAFYKGEGDWVDKVVRWWTKSQYSHVEVIVGDTWYSSSPRDGGVRSMQMEDYNAEH